VSRLRQDQKAHPKALQQLEKQRQALEKKLDGAGRREAVLQRDNEALQVRGGATHAHTACGCGGSHTATEEALCARQHTHAAVGGSTYSRNPSTLHGCAVL
jgi:hypothetical protein